MKLAIALAVAFVIFSSVPVHAGQAQAAAQAQQTAAASAQGAQADLHGGASAQASAAMRPVNGELVSHLDSKSARVGENVVLKTREKVEMADGTVIPKGSRLIGHVTAVEAHSSSHAGSSLALAFDRAELKHGQSIAIHSAIWSVAPPVSTMASSSMDEDDSMATPMGGAAMSGGARGGIGGGRVGAGLVGGAVGATTSATGAAATDLNSSANGVVRTAGDAETDASSAVGEGVHGVAGSHAALTAQATGIPGVMLEGSTSASTSGTLSASRRNVHLDSGTQIQLGIAMAASAQ